MSTCATGASVAPGVDPTTWVPIDSSLYQLLSVSIPWWINIMGALWIPEEQQVSTLCALNPDDPTPPTAGDWAGAILGNGTALNTVHSFIKNKLTYLAFSHYCVCNTSVTCVGAQFTDGTFVGFGGGSGPESISTDIHIDSNTDSPGVYIWSVNTGAINASIDLWDVATTSVIAHCTLVSAPASSHGYAVWDAGTVHLTAGQDIKCSIRKANLSNYPGNTGGSLPTFNPYAHTTGASYNPSGFGYPANSPLGVLPGTHPEFCTPAGPTPPPGPTNPPQPTNLILPGADVCSTDQDICNALESIRMQIAFLMRTVNPLTYVTKFTTGTVHSGLTGQSDIVVSGLIGVEVRLTSVPPSYGTEAGQPPERWSAAKITWSDPFGVVGEQWVGMTRDIYIPPTITLIGYYFAPGVVGEITELTAGV